MKKAFPDFLKRFFQREQPFISKNNKREEYNHSRVKDVQHSLCLAPATNMLFATDGTVKACCHNSENNIGRYPSQSVHEIWNSTAAQAFRKTMEDFRFLSGCSGCATDYHDGFFEQMPARHFDNLPINTQYPVMMEFLLSNTCNLECVMCSGELSSSIRKNREQLPALQSPYDEAFVKQLDEFIPHLKETRFSGAGEAFSIAINYQLWESLIRINNNCLLVVQTNGTILNARVKDFLARGKFQIGVSLDSLQKENFEAIRKNASFDTVMKNIAFFSEYSQQHHRPFTISTCVMRQNWQELPAFIGYCNTLQAHAIFHKVWSPLSCALYNLPADVLQNIHTVLSQYTPPTSTFIEQKNAATYMYFLRVIERWMIDAQSKEYSNKEYDNLNNDALLQVVKNRLADYIEEQPMLEADKLTLKSECVEKLEKVMALWLNEEEQKQTLQKLCSIPVSDILSSLKIHSVEKLFEMSTTQKE